MVQQMLSKTEEEKERKARRIGRAARLSKLTHTARKSQASGDIENENIEIRGYWTEKGKGHGRRRNKQKLLTRRKEN